jgi:hypothetical protein
VNTKKIAKDWRNIQVEYIIDNSQEYRKKIFIVLAKLTKENKNSIIYRKTNILKIRKHK